MTSKTKQRNVIEMERPLPYSAEAEASFLGAVLLDDRVLDEAGQLSPDEFFLDANRTIFRAMAEMSEAHQKIDLVTIFDKLRSQEYLERAGGVAYVSKLIDGIPNGSVAPYVLIIKQKAALRGLIQNANAFQQRAFEAESAEAFELLDEAARALQDYALLCSSPKTLGKSSRESALSLLQGLEEKESLLRINTGVTELDKATGGFRARELVTITASVTGSGKTLFAQQIKRNACANGYHGLYFSGEMPSEQLAAREIATEVGIPHWKLRHPEQLSEEEYKALFDFAKTDCEFCRTIDGELSIKDIRLACRKRKLDGKLSWVVIDYDELVDAPGKDELTQQRNVIREAKRIATTCDVPVFMISQQSKIRDKNESRKPTLERIYGSGAKTKHSSFVIFVDREYVRELKGDETKARICILKSRDGKIGEVPATFDLHKLRFREETTEEAYLRSKKKKAAKQEPESQAEENF